MTKYFIVFFLFISISTFAQTFYVTIPIHNPLSNEAFELNATTCDSPLIFICPPTNNINQYFENLYYEIAMDKNQNLYYVSAWGSLYRRQLNDTTSCQFLGTFNESVIALVADSNNLIYTCTFMNGICKLCSYNISSGVIDTVGILPLGFYPAGDLFFYEHKLFLTGTNSNQTSSYLIEVDIDDPSQSCYYMSLQNLQPWSAFSVNYGAYSKAFILSTVSNSSSSLIELDINNKSIGTPICQYPFLAYGAATYYNLTATTSSCNITSNHENTISPLFFTFQNPVLNSIRITTNIEESQIVVLNLFDIFGKKVKTYSTQIFTRNLDVSDISSGLYIVQLVLSGGETVTTKLIKQAP